MSDLAIAAVVFASTWLALLAMLRSGVAHRLAIDEPTQRSLHSVPTPRVGGLALIPAALAAGRSSYTDRMPVVSVLGAGLWPLLQMTLLPPLTFWFARWWAGRNATKGTFF